MRRPKCLLIALDSVGIDPLGVDRDESVYSRSEFLFPKSSGGPLREVVEGPASGFLMETDVIGDAARGGIECAITYTSIFSGEDIAGTQGLLSGLALGDSALEAAIGRSNLFSVFGRRACLTNAIFPVHFTFLGSSYVEDLVPSADRVRAEALLRFKGEPVRLTGPDKHGFAEIFTLGEINQNIFVHAARQADIPLYTYGDVAAGRALTASMTNGLEAEFNLDALGSPVLPRWSVDEAAHILASKLAEYDFVFYKFQLADLISHTGRVDLARDVFSMMERFIAVVLESVDLATTSVIVTSDHGHLEQVGFSRGHPKSKVPTWGFGPIDEGQAASFGKPEGIHRYIRSLA